MLISCLYIVWYMMREKKQTVVEVTEPTLTDDQMLIIEHRIQRDRYEIGWWKMNGRFNVMQYVKYLFFGYENSV